MFNTERDYKFASDSSRLKTQEYILSPGDRLEMHFFTIDGFKLVDVTNSAGGSTESAINYLIEEDSLTKLPILGKVHLAGLTLRGAEQHLEQLYTKYYINPFIQLKITNRHAYVFFADGGKGTSVMIQNDNTSIIEAIAMAGGLTDNSKAWRIKVVRGDLHNPKVHMIDLSSINGMVASDLTVQSNDIIYVEATPDYKFKVLAQLTPFLGILTSMFLIVNFVNGN